MPRRVTPDTAPRPAHEPTPGRKVTFWSSVESDAFMSGLLRTLSARGFRVRQRYAIGALTYRGARTTIARAAVRLRAYLEYPLRLAWALSTSTAGEVHVVTTNPFFGPWIALLAAPRGITVVHLVYDLFPEALLVAGMIREDALTTRVMRRIVRSTLRRAAANVFLGDRLLRAGSAQFGSIPRAITIPVGADAAPFAANAPRGLLAGTVIDILYCGNVGNMHEVDTVVEGLRALAVRRARPNVSVTFHASGPGYASLRRQLSASGHDGETFVSLDEALSEADWTARMSRAHVALVTMKRGAERVVMPSKTYSALAAGQAILAICERDSDLASLVTLGDCGWLVDPGDVDALLAAIDEIASKPDVLHARRANAFRLGQEVYSEGAIATSWIALLERLPSRALSDAVPGAGALR